MHFFFIFDYSFWNQYVNVRLMLVLKCGIYTMSTGSQNRPINWGEKGGQKTRGKRTKNGRKKRGEKDFYMCK